MSEPSYTTDKDGSINITDFKKYAEEKKIVSYKILMDRYEGTCQACDRYMRIADESEKNRKLILQGTLQAEIIEKQRLFQRAMTFCMREIRKKLQGAHYEAFFAHLSDVMESYADHICPVTGLFEVSPKANYFTMKRNRHHF